MVAEVKIIMNNTEPAPPGDDEFRGVVDHNAPGATALGAGEIPPPPTPGPGHNTDANAAADRSAPSGSGTGRGADESGAGSGSTPSSSGVERRAENGENNVLRTDLRSTGEEQRSASVAAYTGGDSFPQNSMPGLAPRTQTLVSHSYNAPSAPIAGPSSEIQMILSVVQKLVDRMDLNDSAIAVALQAVQSNSGHAVPNSAPRAPGSAALSMPPAAPLSFPASSVNLQRSEFGGSENGSHLALRSNFTAAPHAGVSAAEAESVRMQAEGARNEAAAAPKELRAEADAMRRKIHIRDLAKDIRLFEGKKHDNVDIFIRKVDGIRREYKLSGAEVFYLIKNRSEGAVHICLEKLKEKDQLNPEFVLEALRDRFGERVSEDTLSQNLASLSQGEYDTIGDYFEGAEELLYRKEQFYDRNGIKYDADFLEREVTHRFVAGLRPEFLNQIAGEEYKELTKARARLQKIESGLNRVKEANSQRKARINIVEVPILVESMAPESTHQRPRGRSPQPQFPKGTCFVCGSPDHWAHRCPTRPVRQGWQRPERLERTTRRCYSCGNPNHMAAQCKVTNCQKCGQPGHWAYQCLISKEGTQCTSMETLPKNL